MNKHLDEAMEKIKEGEGFTQVSMYSKSYSGM